MSGLLKLAESLNFNLDQFDHDLKLRHTLLSHLGNWAFTTNLPATKTCRIICPTRNILQSSCADPSPKTK